MELEGQVLVEIEKVKKEFAPVIDFIEQYRPVYIHTKPIWFRINVLDQALNDYIGIGFLDIEQNWFSFILNYLSCDRAEQNGDTIIVVFDRDFIWAISFTLSQDSKQLQAQLYIK